MIFNVGGNNQQTAYEAIYFGGKDQHVGWPDCEGGCNNPYFKNSKCSCSSIAFHISIQYASKFRTMTSSNKTLEEIKL
jgi:hypothetical protein